MSLHIEFYGLPGSGKSTISRIIAQKLMDHGYTVQEPSNWVNNIVGAKKQLIKAVYSIAFTVEHPLASRQICKYIRENGYKRTDLIKQFINVSIKAREYLGNEPETIYVWDEGIAQATLSLVINNDCENAALYERMILNLCQNNSRQVHVYIKEEIDVVLTRLKTRCTNYSRVEKTNDPDAQIELLHRFEKAAECIHSDIRIPGNNEPPQEIADQILDRLTLYLTQ